MSPECGSVYVMSEGEHGEGWLRPTPVDTAVEDAIDEETDLDDGELDDLEAYVDFEDLRALLESRERESLEFDVEGVGVTIHADGTIGVE